MRVAFSIWNERIAPVFDVSQKLLVLDIGDGEIIERSDEAILVEDPVLKVAKLIDMEVQTLVCGAISRPVLEIIDALGINTFLFTAGEVEEVIAAYLEGALPNPSMSMPGSRGRRGGFRGGRCWPQGRDTNEIIERGKARNQERRQAMPRGDGTGPQGKGSGTGRGIGRCGVKSTRRPAGQQGQGQGAGAGMGQGRRGGPGRRKNK